MNPVYSFAENVRHNKKFREAMLYAVIPIAILFAVGFSVMAKSVPDGFLEITKSAAPVVIFLVTVWWILFQVNKTNVSITRKELYGKYKKEDSWVEILGQKTRSIKFSGALSKVEIGNLCIKIDETKAYQLPWYIDQVAANLIRYSDPQKSFNGKTLRVENIFVDPLGKSVEFIFSRSCYFDYLVTNWSRDRKFFHGISVRAALEPGPQLSRLEMSLCENHLGLSVIIVTEDGWTPLFVRSDMVIEFEGHLSPSISGAANVDTFENDLGELSFNSWFLNELHEEVSDRYSMEHFTSIELVGISREALRLGKPEVFFLAKMNLKKEALQKELESVAERKADAQESSVSKQRSILSFIRADGNPSELNTLESIGHTWIKITELRPDQIKLDKKSDELIIEINDKESYLGSESLMVNLAFAIDSLSKDAG
ncbi:hypothetical protein [Mariprofundus ferrooxydans]|uniref:hypothetical protein n=1 Tax=Mariprofundus ferrooxydans TaxID=314344 RepID=UPI00036BC82C|nr:hypothetical protein [Mariprofundus ferrooxydans]